MTSAARFVYVPLLGLLVSLALSHLSVSISFSDEAVWRMPGLFGSSDTRTRPVTLDSSWENVQDKSAVTVVMTDETDVFVTTIVETEVGPTSPVGAVSSHHGDTSYKLVAEESEEYGDVLDNVVDSTDVVDVTDSRGFVAKLAWAAGRPNAVPLFDMSDEVAAMGVVAPYSAKSSTADLPVLPKSSDNMVDRMSDQTVENTRRTGLFAESSLARNVPSDLSPVVSGLQGGLQYHPATPSAGGNPNRVGHPNSAELTRLMYDEIISGLNQRGATGKMGMWQNYAASTLNSSNRTNSGSEIDGRYRLSWYDKLYRNVLTSSMDVDQFSRQLHASLSGESEDLYVGLLRMREKLDVPKREDGGVRFTRVATSQQAVQEIRRCLIESQSHFSGAYTTLSAAELTELNNNVYQTLCNSQTGHTVPQRGMGKRMCDLLQKTNRKAIHNAMESLTPITNQQLLETLRTLPDDAFASEIVQGQRMQRVTTSAGDILIGGRENNVYQLDGPEFANVVCVIDLGGNDTFLEGTCTAARPMFVVISLSGNDTFRATRPAAQGASILGISMLLNLDGDDTYIAQDVAQGTTIGGMGILIDYSGNDSYLGLRRAQGSALAGIGLLVDKKGQDKYRAALWAQGFGHPGGFGVLEDVTGNDNYYCGGLYLDSYPEHPGYDGWGQGVGAGLRQVANGGVGMILEGDGDDTYECDYFAHGGGYWLGVGVARDFGGNDKRVGATMTGYSGGPRSEKRWIRFSSGWGCHYALGFLIDDAGNDVYDGTIMGTGMGWDLSIGYLMDFAGNDKYPASGGMTLGVGAEGSIGVLFSYGGDDEYMSRNQGIASSNLTYHTPQNCGANFSFAIDYGGTDTYASGLRNNSYNQRSTATGFLIDRPLNSEVDAAKSQAATVAAAAAEQAAATPTTTPTTTNGSRTVPSRVTPQQQQRTQVPPALPPIQSVRDF